MFGDGEVIGGLRKAERGGGERTDREKEGLLKVTKGLNRTMV